jgi:TonB family protein
MIARDIKLLRQNIDHLEGGGYLNRCHVAKGKPVRIWWALPIVATLGVQIVESAAQGSSMPLAPSSKWQMDYASGECRLIRSFGEGKDLVTLQFARGGDIDAIEMAIAGRRMPATGEEVPVSVGTSTVAQVHGMHAQGVAMEDHRLGSIRFHLDVDLPTALRSDVSKGKSTVLSVAFVRGYAVALNLGSMKAPLAALDACADDLVKGWGVDLAEMRRQRSGPRPANNVSHWFRKSDYPDKQDHQGAGGLVSIRLVIGVDGAVKKCEVHKSGGDKAFEDLTCRLASERARFVPAIGADGRPIVSLWERRVNWKPGQSFFAVQ